jgi:carbohydrate diacid regulator
VSRQSGHLDLLAADLADRAFALARAATDAAVLQESFGLTLTDRREVRDRFIYELLLTSAPNEADLLRQADIMGMDLTRPRAVILLDGGVQSTREQAEHRIRQVVRFFHLPNDTICGFLGSGEVAILKAASTGDLAQWASPPDRPGAAGSSWANLGALKRAAAELANQLATDGGDPVDVGVGRYHPGLPGLGQSYRDARAALSLGRQYQPGRTVYALDEIGLGAWVGLSDAQSRLDLASRLVGPLAVYADLLSTLDVFFAENGSACSSAARLCIHRNTLSYRLDRVARLTGLDPRRFDDAVQLRLCLLLRSRTNMT